MNNVLKISCVDYSLFCEVMLIERCRPLGAENTQASTPGIHPYACPPDASFSTHNEPNSLFSQPLPLLLSWSQSTGVVCTAPSDGKLSPLIPPFLFPFMVTGALPVFSEMSLESVLSFSHYPSSDFSLGLLQQPPTGFFDSSTIPFHSACRLWPG